MVETYASTDHAPMSIEDPDSDPIDAIERLRRKSVDMKTASAADGESSSTVELSLRILVVDQNLMRASVLEEGLREAGYTKVTVVRDMQNLMRRIVDLEPDVIFIDLENPNRDVLEQMFQVSRCVARPVAMFVDRSDAATISAAIEAGVSAYVVDGLKKERVKSILDTAMSRFNAFNRLREELDRTKQALEERKLVDRAKGILMRKRGVTEEEAYALMRKAAMNENRRIGEIAQSILTAAQLLK
jgi:two-component system, response regulator / RNA-binding antiterminator